MVNYVIINGTNAELTNVNAGGTDVAAYTISGNVALDATELAAVCALDGVAVMQASASAAEKTAVGNLLIGGSGAAPGVSYRLFNGGAAVDNVNAAGDDLPAYSTLTATLTPAELAAAITATVGVGLATATQEQRRKIAKVTEQGALSGVKTS